MFDLITHDANVSDNPSYPFLYAYALPFTTSLIFKNSHHNSFDIKLRVHKGSSHSTTEHMFFYLITNIVWKETNFKEIFRSSENVYANVHNIILCINRSILVNSYTKSPTQIYIHHKKVLLKLYFTLKFKKRTAYDIYFIG